MADTLIDIQNGRSSERQTEWEVQLPIKDAVETRKRTNRWTRRVRTGGSLLIIVGVLYPFGSWLWQTLSDWVMSSFLIHLATLETHLRVLTGITTYYPT